jgi:hypothetical protein
MAKSNLMNTNINNILETFKVGIFLRYNQQDVTFLNFMYFNSTLQLSGGTSTHHQELGLYIQILLLTVAIMVGMKLVLVFVKPCCYLLRSWSGWNSFWYLSNLAATCCIHGWVGTRSGVCQTLLLPAAIMVGMEQVPSQPLLQQGLTNTRSCQYTPSS